MHVKIHGGKVSRRNQKADFVFKCNLRNSHRLLDSACNCNNDGIRSLPVRMSSSCQSIAS